MKERFARIALGAVLFIGAAGAVACDEKEQRHIGKVGNDIKQNVEQGIDKVDDDDSK